MSIRQDLFKLNDEKKSIESKINSLQKSCNHKTSVYSAHGSSGNWDRDDYYWFNFYCYDCQKRWSTDQKKGSSISLKVDEIKYDENPEVIELLIKIKDLKK